MAGPCSRSRLSQALRSVTQPGMDGILLGKGEQEEMCLSSPAHSDGIRLRGTDMHNCLSSLC